MSRILILNTLKQAVVSAERALSDEIHKVLHADRVIWYQVGFSENATSWAEYKVVGPFDKFKIIIRPVSGDTRLDLRVDGRSHRLSLDVPPLFDKTDPEGRMSVIVGKSLEEINRLREIAAKTDITVW